MLQVRLPFSAATIYIHRADSDYFVQLEIIGQAIRLH